MFAISWLLLSWRTWTRAEAVRSATIFSSRFSWSFRAAAPPTLITPSSSSS